MTEAIVVALITATASIIGQWLISRKQKADNETRQAVRDAQFEDRLKHIEERLEQHNQYAEKLGDVAISLAKMSKDIEYLKAKQ
jgi:NAD dependent epimerase/dehydratase family enzyme